MSQIDNSQDQTIDLIDELDDVEGHGLKEVAAGLGVAAVVVGGAGVAQGLTNSAQHSPMRVAPISTHVNADLSDPIGTVDRVTDSALSEVRSARDTAMTTATTTATGAQNTATGAATSAVSYTQAVAGAAQTVAQGAVTYAQGTAAAAETTAINAATTTIATAKTAVDGTVKDANATVAGVTGYAGRVVGATETTVNQTVASAGQTVETTLKTANTVVGNAVTTVVKITHLDAGAGVDASSATGWVRVSAGGVMLGEAHVSSGEATVHWVDPTGDRTVTLTYSGDSLFPGSSVAL